MSWLILVAQFLVSVSVAAPGSVSVAATESETETETVIVPLPEQGYLFSTIEPFVPHNTDYSLEIGAMAENRSLYWVAANLGQKVGRCLFTRSESCQQYVDGIIGVGGRDEETHGVFLASLRWQFINYPRSWSPLLRIFAGETYAHLRDVKEWRLTYGAGIGVTTFLHEKVDLRFEVRAGEVGVHPFVQGLIGVQLKR